MVNDSFVLCGGGVMWRGAVKKRLGRSVVKKKRYDGFIKQQSIQTLRGRDLEDGET